VRFVAGVVSAWTFVFVSQWGLRRLAELHAPEWSGVIYAGPVGIVLTGLIGEAPWPPRGAGLAGFAALSALLSAAIWRTFGRAPAPVAPAAAVAPAGPSRVGGAGRAHAGRRGDACRSASHRRAGPYRAGPYRAGPTAPATAAPAAAAPAPPRQPHRASPHRASPTARQPPRTAARRTPPSRRRRMARRAVRDAGLRLHHHRDVPAGDRAPRCRPARRGLTCSGRCSVRR
jgi:hypothetical protein